MAATLCVKILQKQGWLPLTQSVRHGSKAVTRHKRPMHILKQKLMVVTKYVPPAPGPPRGAYPDRAKKVQEESPFALLLKREVTKVFQDCKMIAVVQNNGSKTEDLIVLKHRLNKHGITIRFFPNQVMRSFLKDSVYSNMAPLIIGPTVLFVSKEPKVKEMLSTLRISQQMTLLGACIDHTLLTAQGVLAFSKLPALTVVQGELVSGLTMLTSRTASLLRHHPAHLSALLQQYIKQQSPDASTGAPKAEEAT